jgi:hypothetical protein
MIVIDEKFLVIKEINGYLVDMILINSFRSGSLRVNSSEDNFEGLPQQVSKLLDFRFVVVPNIDRFLRLLTYFIVPEEEK